MPKVGNLSDLAVLRIAHDVKRGAQHAQPDVARDVNGLLTAGQHQTVGPWLGPKPWVCDRQSKPFLDHLAGLREGEGRGLTAPT